MKVYSIVWNPSNTDFDMIHSIESEMRKFFNHNGGKVHGSGGHLETGQRDMSGRIPEKMKEHFYEDVESFFENTEYAELVDVEFVRSVENNAP